nr:MAG TPA: hypothetical protein [Caudoviricetes sp.]
MTVLVKTLLNMYKIQLLYDSHHFYITKSLSR